MFSCYTRIHKLLQITTTTTADAERNIYVYQPNSTKLMKYTRDLKIVKREDKQVKTESMHTTILM